MIKKQESNFKKAINELLGYNPEQEGESDLPEYREEQQAAEIEDLNQVEIPVPVPAPDPIPAPVPNPGPIPGPAPNSARYSNPVRMTAETSKVSSYTTVETKTLSMDPVNQMPSNVSVVTEDMIINGDIATQTDLNIFGQVTGSIVSRGDVLVLGRVMGDITCVNLRIEGEVNGNLTVDQKVEVGGSARVKGDITATNVSSEGVTEGDIKAEETIYLGGNAIVTGKIYAKSFAILQGAKIKGMMTTYD